MNRKSALVLAGSIALCFFGGVASLSAATLTWDGGGADNKFGTTANWNPDTVVTGIAGADIRIGAGPQATADVNVGATSVRSISMRAQRP